MAHTTAHIYTCDVCGILVPETTVVSYKIVCPMPGTGAASFEAAQVYGCTGAHAVQAAQQSLSALEVQRTSTPAS